MALLAPLAHTSATATPTSPSSTTLQSIAAFPGLLSGHFALLSFYARQSEITGPGPYASMFDDLPHDVPSLVRVVQGVVIDFRMGLANGISIPPERRKEAGSRTVERMLASIARHDSQPLEVARPPERRFVGSSRDYAVLLCSMLRHVGIPARVRCGFARYAGPQMCYDRWACEYWNDWQQRWVMVDAAAGDPVEKRVRGISFNPLDVPRTRFYGAGKAWQMCRIWGADPARFGLFPEGCGLGYVASQLVRDLACLNRAEVLPWDAWGLAESAFRYLSPADLQLLDRVAALTLAGNEAFPDLRDLYDTNPALRVPSAGEAYQNIA